MDEEMDLMREMEMEAAGQPNSAAQGQVSLEKPPTLVTTPVAPAATTEVEDSQPRPRLLGAFDDEALYDSPDEEQAGYNGRPLRVFKKKGRNEPRAR